jgi:hypothetical protein
MFNHRFHREGKFHKLSFRDTSNKTHWYYFISLAVRGLLIHVNPASSAKHRDISSFHCPVHRSGQIVYVVRKL